MTHLKNHLASAILAVLLLISAHALAQPAVRLTSASGHPGDEVELAIQTQGMAQITAMQLNITLPQALTYVESSAVLGNEIVSPNHQLQVTQTDNQLKIYVYSLQLEVMKDAQGQLMTFRLHIGNESGTYQLKPVGVLSNSKGENVSATITSGEVTVLGPSIKVSPEEIDFERKPIRGTYLKTIVASNTGNEPLTVTGAECSSTLFNVAGLPCTIQAGGRQELTVSYAPMAAGEDEAIIKITSDAVNGLQTIRVKGQSYSVNELHVTCSSETENGQFLVSVAMENMEPIVAVQCSFELPDALLYVDGSALLNASRSNGHQLSASMVDGKLKVYIHSTTNTAIPANDGELFSFCIQPDGASGNYQLMPSDIILSNVDGDNMLSGNTNAEVHVSAPKLEAKKHVDFGNFPWAKEISYSYQVRNTGEKPLTISRIEIDNPALTVSTALPLTIEAGTTKDLGIAYHPENEGDFQGVMLLYCDDPDQRMVVVNLKGSTYHPNQVSLSGKESKTGQYALTVNLQNTLPIVAMQADLHWLPGMITNSELVTFSSRATSHRAVITPVSEGTYRLFVYSESNQEISVGEGSLLTIIYNKENTEQDIVGTTITIDNIILSGADEHDHASVAQATLTVTSRLPGDVNGDGLVTVADVSTVVDVLLERQTPNISSADADINGDGKVTIVDVVEEIQLVLTNKQ